MSKKIMSVMLAIFMLASFCVVGITSASAVDNGTYYEGYRMKGGAVTNGNDYAKKGDTVVATLTVDTNGHYGVNGQMELFYDNTKLEAIDTSDDVQGTWPAVCFANPTSNFTYTATGTPMAMGVHVNYSTLNGINFDNENVVYKYTFKVLEDVDNLGSLFCQEFHSFGLYDETGKQPKDAPYSNFVKDDLSGLKDGVTAVLTVTGGSKKPSEPTIDVSALQTRIADAKALAAKTDVYTAESIAALNEAITAAEAVAANPESQDQVDAQVTALQSAMDALEKVQGPVEINTTALEALIADAKEYAEKDIYTEDSVAALKNAIAAAEAVVANPESQEKVDEQLKALQAAIDGLKKVDDTPAESTTTEQTTTAQTTTAQTTTAQTTTEKPSAPQTGEASTAVALMVVAIMAAGVVIFARKKAVK